MRPSGASAGASSLLDSGRIPSGRLANQARPVSTATVVATAPGDEPFDELDPPEPPDPPGQPGDEPVEYLVERVRTAIATRSEIHELGIGVQVAGGRLLLTGSASSLPQRDAITGVVEEVAPGYEVVNEVCVAPTTPPAAVEQL